MLLKKGDKLKKITVEKNIDYKTSTTIKVGTMKIYYDGELIMILIWRSKKNLRRRLFQGFLGRLKEILWSKKNRGLFSTTVLLSVAITEALV